MNPRYFAFGFVALVIGTFPAVAQQDPISFKGHWHVDSARSSVPYGPLPKSVTLDVMVDDSTTYEATETIVGADGNATQETIHAPYDGKPYPVVGSPLGLTVAMSRLPNGSHRLETNLPSGLHVVEICRVSVDLKTIICNASATGLRGDSKLARSVYVRD